MYYSQIPLVTALVELLPALGEGRNLPDQNFSKPTLPNSYGISTLAGLAKFHPTAPKFILIMGTTPIRGGSWEPISG